MGTTADLLVSRPRSTSGGVAILLLSLNAGLSSAHAEDVAALSTTEPTNSMLGRAGTRSTAADPPRVTLEQSRLASDDPALRINGVDAYGRPLVELGGVTYRWWVSRGSSNFGLGVGAIGTMAPALDAQQAAGMQSGTYSASVLTLGWRFQVNDNSTLFADASGARRFDSAMPDRYMTKVGVEWKGKTSKLGIDGGSRSLGLQLDSGYKMSLKVRRNGVGLYLRGQF